ncbi:MAG: hypothetical protein Q4C58_01835, partial [Eubacteriales bacterium]|nr:hypothetical protein [Eubacteriales bacterium]
PASSAWEADVLPMNYICMFVIIAHSFQLEKSKKQKFITDGNRPAGCRPVQPFYFSRFLTFQRP